MPNLFRIRKKENLPLDFFQKIFGSLQNFHYFCTPKRRGARVVEEARLESVYTPKGYHEFESRSLRRFNVLEVKTAVLFYQSSRFFDIVR